MMEEKQEGGGGGVFYPPPGKIGLRFEIFHYDTIKVTPFLSY